MQSLKDKYKSVEPAPKKVEKVEKPAVKKKK